MTREAAGAFEVKVVPIAQTEHAGGTTLGRFALDKVFRGEREGTSLGEMLTAGTCVAGLPRPCWPLWHVTHVPRACVWS